MSERTEQQAGRRSGLLFCLILTLPLSLLLACAGSGAVGSGARWACPSPTPQPYGPAGPVKATRTYTVDGQLQTEPIYYAEWEQEYGALGGPPFPSPTPYALRGTTFLLGQRVAVAGVFVTVTAAPGARVTRAGVAPDTQQVHLVTITWINPGDQPIPFAYAAQVRVREVARPDGRLITDATWGVTAEALAAAGVPALPDAIPPGTSTVQVPVLGPAGQPHTVELQFPAGGSPVPTDAAPTDVPAVPVANPDLRDPTAPWLVVQWTTGSLRTLGPPCGDAGAITPWTDGPYIAWGRQTHPALVAAPAGAGRVVQLALNQVGKRYVWGAKGPETFDCSGLVSWAYGQIGIHIPAGTAGQWPGLRPVSAADLQPGDLVFFAIDGGRIDHVGMLVGDLDGDGRWDMVHAANPMLGVRIESDLFGSAYYTQRIRGFRTAR